MVKQNTETVKNNKSSKKDCVHAVGRRREAVARVRLYADPKANVVWKEQTVEAGGIFVNGKPIVEYFPGLVAKSLYEEPFKAIKGEGKFIATIAVAGGGKSGQLDAVVHGLSRALVKHNKEFRTILKKKKLLSRDARVKERRKVGTGGKARRKKQSPKR